MNKFTGVDYFNIDSLLSDEEIMIRESVREFVSDEVIPIIEEYQPRRIISLQLVPKMAEMGLFGSTLPPKYGCAEMNNVAYGLVMQELGKRRQRNKKFCFCTKRSW